MFFFVFTVDCSFTKWLLHCVLCLFASIQFLCFFVVELSVYIYAVNQLLCTLPVYDAVHFIPTELQGLVTPKNKILVFTIVQNQLYQALFWGSFTAMWHTNNAGNVFFFFVGSCRRKKMLHSWHSSVTMKDGQNAHSARRKAGHCFSRTTCSVALILLSPRRLLRPPSFVNGCFIRLAYVPDI